jgi:putative hydrolase of the HAD superfamily
VIRAIVFDLDNTLTDFMRMKHEAIEAAIDGMIDAGFRIEREALRARIDTLYRELGLESQRVFDELLQREFGEVDPKILAAGIVAYRRARESAMVPYPHVHLTLLELVRRGIRLGVVSDAPRLQVWLRLCELKLQHHFEAVVTFDDTGERKPSPAPFREVLRRLGVEPHESMMVGDWAERDVVGGRSLGMRTAFARYGDTFDTQESGADHDLDDVMQLVRIVDELRGAPPARGA